MRFSISGRPSTHPTNGWIKYGVAFGKMQGRVNTSPHSICFRFRPGWIFGFQVWPPKVKRHLHRFQSFWIPRPSYFTKNGSECMKPWHTNYKRPLQCSIHVSFTQTTTRKRFLEELDSSATTLCSSRIHVLIISFVHGEGDLCVKNSVRVTVPLYILCLRSCAFFVRPFGGRYIGWTVKVWLRHYSGHTNYFGAFFQKCVEIHHIKVNLMPILGVSAVQLLWLIQINDIILVSKIYMKWHSVLVDAPNDLILVFAIERPTLQFHSFNPLLPTSSKSAVCFSKNFNSKKEHLKPKTNSHRPP